MLCQVKVYYLVINLSINIKVNFTLTLFNKTPDVHLRYTLLLHLIFVSSRYDRVMLVFTGWLPTIEISSNPIDSITLYLILDFVAEYESYRQAIASYTAC